MPEYWHNLRRKRKDDDDLKDEYDSDLNQKIVASKKPYFMIHVYPTLKKENRNYISNNNSDIRRKFIRYGFKDINDLKNFPDQTQEMADFILNYNKNVLIGENPCTINRICCLFENIFDSYFSKRFNQINHPQFNYSILKCRAPYSKKNYMDILKLYKDYRRGQENFHMRASKEKLDDFDIWTERKKFIDRFQRDCALICTNERELCDILLDICYSSEKTKQFVWDVCGNVILDNLLDKKCGKIHFPKITDTNGEFEYCGEQFKMIEKDVGGELNDYIE